MDLEIKQANMDRPGAIAPSEDWWKIPQELPNDLAYMISDALVAARPTSIEITGGFKQTFDILGGVQLTWLTRGAEISITIFNDGEVHGFVGNVERHFSWQVEDYTEIWSTIQSVLPEYQRW